MIDRLVIQDLLHLIEEMREGKSVNSEEETLVVWRETLWSVLNLLDKIKENDLENLRWILTNYPGTLGKERCETLRRMQEIVMERNV